MRMALPGLETFVSFCIILRIWINCLSSLFISLTLVPLPFAILILREPFISLWLFLSLIVIDEMMASRKISGVSRLKSVSGENQRLFSGPQK